MPLIDLILNLAGLLLWLSWQAIGITAATRPTALSLVYTLKRTEPRPPRRRTPLLFLLALLVGRSLVYWQLGPGTQWNPFLNLGVVTLRFPAESWGYMSLYSLLSFGQILGTYYLALLLVAVANIKTLDSDPLHRIVRMQLGFAGRLPLFLALLTPLLAGALFWFLAGWPFGRLGLYTPTPTLDLLWQQALIFGLGTYLVWQYLIIVLLIIHLFNSYVYLGNSPFWSFLAVTGRNSLRPIRWLPLTMGRLDTTPLFAIGLAFLAGYHWANWGRWLFAHPPWR
jgi:uncharacterized protein YggT (Ycf19 family)